MPDVFVAHHKKTKVNPKLKDEKDTVKGSHKPSFKKILEKEKSSGPLVAFSFLPNRINFETRENQEEVVLFLRQHPIVNFPWILLSSLMIFAPLLVSGFEFFESVPANFRFIFLLLWYLITIAFSLEKFLTWFFNVYIVTDERIVDIDFYNLIYKEVSDAKIDRIQDVTYNMGGVIRTVFNYGNVLIQTASEIPNFEFIAVPKPDKVARVLLDLQIEEEQEAIEGRVR